MEPMGPNAIDKTLVEHWQNIGRTLVEHWHKPKLATLVGVDVFAIGYYVPLVTKYPKLKLHAFNAIPYQVCDVISFENLMKNILQTF